MKPLQAFAIVCLIPLSVLTATAIAAAVTIPTGADRTERIERAREAAPSAAAPEVASPAAAAQDPDAKADGAQDDESHDPMDEHMSVLQDGMRSMRRMLGKEAQQEAAIELSHQLQAAAVACFDLVPPTTAAIEDAKARTESRIGYQRRMVQVYDTLLQLELAFHQGDGDKQKELYRALGEQKNSGHDAYQ